MHAYRKNPRFMTGFPRKSMFLLAALGLAAALALAAACGGGGSSTATPTGSSSTSHPDPEPTLRSLVDSLNNGDLQTFYNGLSADRRASTSVAQLQTALDNVRLLAGSVPKLEITTITAKRINGDSAEVDATLTVRLGTEGLPVTDTALLQWEDGSWHLADHFLDQALAVLGAGGGGGASRTPTGTPSS